MKKTLTTTCSAIASAVLLSLAAQSAMADSGTINFSGAIAAATCSVSAGGANSTVVLPTVAANQLATVDALAGKTNFSITLSGCIDVAKSARIRWNGANISSTRGDLNTNQENVALLVNNIINGVESQEHLPMWADHAYQISATGDTVIDYNVQYRALGPVTAGAITSSVDYLVAYE